MNFSANKEENEVLHIRREALKKDILQVKEQMHQLLALVFSHGHNSYFEQEYETLSQQHLQLITAYRNV